MQKLRSIPKSMCAVAAVVALTMLWIVPVASAHSGEFERFNACPSTNPEVSRCIVSQTTGGMTVLGKAALPIVNPVTIQGGITAPNQETGISNFVDAINGVSLSRSPQPVPGGLIGILAGGHPAAINNRAVRLLAERSINRVFATLELAGPSSQIGVNFLSLLSEEGVALKLPIKIHLENPLLGSSCRIASNASPIVLSLTTGTTSPPPPNQPIVGASGEFEIKEEGRILQLTDANLVDNAWSAPRAEHCGGILAPLIDPIINHQLGLPSAAGNNTAVLQSTIDIATPAAVNSQ